LSSDGWIVIPAPNFGTWNASLFSHYDATLEGVSIKDFAVFIDCCPFTDSQWLGNSFACLQAYLLRYYRSFRNSGSWSELANPSDQVNPINEYIAIRQSFRACDRHPGYRESGLSRVNGFCENVLFAQINGVSVKNSCLK
jgi:hypothetical protein